MEKEDWNLKGGALIIGSLLWQDYLKKKDNSVRKDWRENQLIEKKRFLVKVPIRYGRLSDIRDENGNKINKQSYTMVFSKTYLDENKFGNAYVLPILKTINKWEDLESEVKEFSNAEGGNEKFVMGKYYWCTMAIIFNPKIEKEIKKSIKESWLKALRNDAPHYSFDEYKFGKEDSILNTNGFINISWPEVVNNVDANILNEIDFVICSATKQKNVVGVNRYPTAEEIAEKENNENIRNYFKNNIANGIMTADDAIIKCMLTQI